MKPGTVIKTFKSKKGNEVVFRTPVREDFEFMWKFACALCAEDTFVELSGKPPTREEEKKWFDAVLKKQKNNDAIHIVVIVGEEFAGNAEVRIGVLRHKHVGNIGLSLLPEYRDEGIGTEILKALISESKKLGLKLLTLNCFENNLRAVHVYKKLGFQTGGIIPGSLKFKGAYVGEVIMYLPLV